MARANGFFVEQMAQYSAYHRDGRNRATHMIGIPAIAYSLLVAMSLAQVSVGESEVTLAMLFMAASLVFYVVLDWGLGLAMAAFYVPVLVLAHWTAAQGGTTAWTVFAVFFVGGWVFQLVGHVFEGRRPALVDNLLQALIGPMFIMAELLMMLGLRRELHDALESRWHAYAAPVKTGGKAT